MSELPATPDVPLLMRRAFIPTTVLRTAAAAVALAVISGHAQDGEALPPGFPRQYKREHQEAFKAILAGKIDVAIADLEALLAKVPGDAESRFMLAVAHCRSGDLDAARGQVEAALAAGLPPDRIVGGTLTGLEAFHATDAGRMLRAGFAHRVVHGPMLGAIGPDRVRVWVRTAGPAEVAVIASTHEDLADPIRSDPVATNASTDFTGVATVTGLAPGTRYHYAVLVDGARAEDAPGSDGSFTTPPPVGEPVVFRLAFGGGAGFVPPNERAWTTIAAQKPDLLVLLGDNVYSDAPETPAMQHYCYYRRQSRPEFRRLVAHTPVQAIWDDHDFGTNDCQGGPAIDDPPWKRPVYEVFRNNWANPAFGGGDANPGVWFDFRIGDVHFIMLDGRYYRDLHPAGGARPTMLGPVQKAWLLETLRSSEATFRVLCSPVPWVFEAKGDSRDTWNGFREERDEIFGFLAEHDLEGVVLMSADRHRSDLWKIGRSDGYPLYELNSSRLTNQHVHAEMKKAVFSYNRKQSFGLVDIDTTVDDPTMTYSIVTIDGETVFTFTIRRSELR